MPNVIICSDLDEVCRKLKKLKRDGWSVFPKDHLTFNYFGICAKLFQDECWLKWPSINTTWKEVFIECSSLDEMYKEFNNYKDVYLFRSDHPAKLQIGFVHLDNDNNLKTVIRSHMRVLTNKKGWGPIKDKKALEILDWSEKRHKILNDQLQKMYSEL